MLVNDESNLADLKLGENHFTLNTYRTIVKAVEGLLTCCQASGTCEDARRNLGFRSTSF